MKCSVEKQQIFMSGKGDNGELGFGDKQDLCTFKHLDCKEFAGMVVQSIACGSAFSAAVAGN